MGRYLWLVFGRLLQRLNTHRLRDLPVVLRRCVFELVELDRIVELRSCLPDDLCFRKDSSCLIFPVR